MLIHLVKILLINIFVTNDIFGKRPLGTTNEFKPSSSISFGGGKFLDEVFVYPPNHQYIIGTTRDSIDNLIYQGTQNKGGDTIESQAYTDLQDSAFYRVLTTGTDGFTVTGGY